MERMLRTLLDMSLIRLLRYIKNRLSPPEEAVDNVYKAVNRRAVQSSAEFVESHLDEALLFATREQLWDFVVPKAKGDGMFAEFGVFSGWSINCFARLLQARGLTIYGFDSFEGLKEDWRGTSFASGHFNRGGELPEVQSNVRLVKGWFDQTLPAFLAAHPDEYFSFVHIDADTFESASLVLALLAGRLAQGTIVLFDEYLGFPNWQNGEFRAWQEFATSCGIRFQYLAFATTQAAIRLL